MIKTNITTLATLLVLTFIAGYTVYSVYSHAENIVGLAKGIAVYGVFFILFITSLMLGGMLISWMQKSEIEILSQIGYGIENISEFLVTIVIVASFFGPIIAIIYLLIFN
ncbi:MAG TPA: hypothetical protein VFE57_07210 [Cyclobacteriaceae bacterium]|nr:hypothetical protein [Cyclobacteriaceae bacterium]